MYLLADEVTVSAGDSLDSVQEEVENVDWELKEGSK